MRISNLLFIPCLIALGATAFLPGIPDHSNRRQSTVIRAADGSGAIRVTRISELVESQALADDADPVITEPAASEYVDAAGHLVGWVKLGVLGIIFAVVQVLLLVARSSFDPVKSRAKIILVMGLTLVAGVIGLIMAGSAPLAAILDATNLGVLQVFLHQLVIAQKPVA